MTIQENTFYMNFKKSVEDNAKDAAAIFPFLGESGSVSLILWLKARPSMCGVIDYSELETLEGLIF